MTSDYFKGILPDLQESSCKFADVEIVGLKSHGEVQRSVSTNSLVLASLSPIFKSILLNHSTMDHSAEENVKILIPDLEFHALQRFFYQVVFNIDCEAVEIDKTLEQVIDILGISLPNKSVVAAAIAEEESKCTTINLCNICNKQFSIPKLLRRHMKTYHSHNNPNTCPDCGKPCRSQSELQIHQRSHTKERPHTCHICHKAFTQVSHLNEHLRVIHDNDHEEICEVCGLAFPSKVTVLKHMKIHQNEDEQEKEVDEEPVGTVTPVSSTSNKPTTTTTPIQRKMLSCPEENCGKLLKTQTSLKLHLSTQHVQDEQKRTSFQCTICQKSFTQKSHLTVHERIHSGAKPHMCSVCGKQFSVKSNLKKHLRMHEKNTNQNCNAILGQGLANDAIFNNLECWKENVNNHSKNNVCEFCGKAYGSMGELEQHVKVHTHDKPYECLTCATSFATRSELRIHEKIHTGEEQHNCSHCQTAWVSKSALEKHLLIHTLEKPFECEQCGKSFRQKSQLNYHGRTVHGALPKDRPRNHICFHCGSAFTTASTLRKHVKIHTQERPHCCKYCGKGFIQKVHLQTHLLRHSGEKPWLCNVCGKGFVTSAVLKEHVKLHQGSGGQAIRRKTWDCDKCNAKYANSADLKIHAFKHTGEKPFTCIKCSKGFRSKRLLQEHLRTHSDFKPFACANCGKTFTSASGLRQHFKRHDTCKLASLPGSFSLVNPQIINEAEDTGFDKSSEALLVDFLPAASNDDNAGVVGTVQEDSVILIDNQTFANLSSSLPTPQ